MSSPIPKPSRNSRRRKASLAGPSNQNFLALQSQLEGTENRIAIARGDYIKAVQAYNTEIRTIPGRWWRAVLYPDAQPMQNFTVAEETTKVPEVKF
jgi:LemA protein